MPKTLPEPLSLLDPQIAEFVRRLVAETGKHPPREALTPAEAREVAEISRAQWTAGGPEMARTEERMIPTRHGEVMIRIYRPKVVRTDAAFLYLPGGGWVLFSVNTHDRLMREYADGAGMVVIGLQYSRAPEAKFPQPVEEAADAFGWIHGHAAELGIDPAKIAMGGDSAGSNLTAASSLMRRDQGLPLPAAAIYNYGAFDMGFFKPSTLAYGSGAYVLSTHMMLWFTMNYLADPEHHRLPLASPLQAPDKSGLPPAFMVITDYDVLRDDQWAWAEALKAAGVEVEARLYPGTVHSFLEAMSIAEVSRRAIAETCAWLNARFGG